MPCLVSISLVNETVETWMMCLAVQDTKLVHALKAETVDHDLLHVMVDSLARDYSFR